ncbi:glycosyltransferase family 2 protein [Archangium gephyra]|nr:glycosyltransferase family 2 protein [Archangium gephyra]
MTSESTAPSARIAFIHGGDSSEATAGSSAQQARIAVVIPSFKVTRHIMQVLARIGPEVSAIYVVDDCCPDQSGALVERECKDPRVKVLRNPVNLGVGGAVMTGYRAAVADGCDCIVKIDGDGQMSPELLPRFVAPILSGTADYTKGNRFYHIEDVVSMPRVRLFGNAVLSFMNKMSSGYWRVFDPTNGYTAISAPLAASLPYEKISNRYFFESDMLFRVGLMQAVVEDIPMRAVYGDEQSNLKISRILPQFLKGHLRNLMKRIGYEYFLRDFSVASIELVLGLALTLFALLFGTTEWWKSVMNNTPASSGTVMLAALPLILGVQFLLSFLSYDIRARGPSVISKRLPKNPEVR